MNVSPAGGIAGVRSVGKPPIWPAERRSERAGRCRAAKRSGLVGSVAQRFGLFRKLFLLLGAGFALGASPVDVYVFPDAATEARYHALIAELRCPKCLNTNLAGSDAPIAQDLRAAVHRLIVREGFADRQVREYLQVRYGDFILYDPPMKPATLILWAGPIVFAAIGLGLLARRLRRQQQARLSDADRARLRRILDAT